MDAWDPRAGGELLLRRPSRPPLAGDAVFELLVAMGRQGACVAASVASDSGEDRDTYKALGIVAGHAYSVLKVLSFSAQRSA